jgi:acyl-CoA reductase-like NAD-dependent aldehyde dehydrogenase
VPTALPRLRLTAFIDGVFIEPAGAADALLNPATGEVIASVTPASSEQVLTAINAARRAFDEGDWPRMPVFERGQILHAIADGIMARSEDLALLECVNGGKPITGARREVAATPFRSLKIS